MNQSQQITLQRKSIWDVITDFFKAIGRFFFSVFSSKESSHTGSPITLEEGVKDKKVNYEISITEVAFGVFPVNELTTPTMSFKINFESGPYVSQPNTPNEGINDFQVDIFISTNSNNENGTWEYPSEYNLRIDQDTVGVGDPMIQNSLTFVDLPLNMHDRTLTNGDLHGIKMEFFGNNQFGDIYYHGIGFVKLGSATKALYGEFYVTPHNQPS